MLECVRLFQTFFQIWFAYLSNYRALHLVIVRSPKKGALSQFGIFQAQALASMCMRLEMIWSASAGFEFSKKAGTTSTEWKEL